MKRIKTLIAVTASLCAIVASSQAALVADGGFESGAVSGFFTTYGTGPMGGWDVTAGSVDLIGTYWPAPEGKQSLDLSGLSRGTISQSILLGAGTYQLSFLMSGNIDGPPSPKTVEVSLSGAQQFSSVLSAQSSQWETKTATFTISTAGSYLLQFQDISAAGSLDAYGAALDDIQLTAVPEPTTMIAGALLLLPFGASTLRILRRNRTA